MGFFHFMVRGVITVIASLSFASVAQAQQADLNEVGMFPIDCPPGGEERAGPIYPRALSDQAATVKLVTSVDRCGFVTAVAVEPGEAQVEFIKAAIKAAKQWRIAPPAGARGEKVWRARIPVDFDNSTYRDPDVPCDRHKVVRHMPMQPVQAMAADARTVFSVSVDECGWPVEIVLIGGSGYAQLDTSAFSSIKTWHFSPRYRDGKQVLGPRRVQIDFTKPSEERLKKLAKNWEAIQVAKVEVAADGTMDGYLPDPTPIEGASEDIRRRLESDAIRFSRDDEIGHYRENDTHWYVFNPPAYVSALVRRRLVSDGEKLFKVVSVRCESDVAKNCVEFEASVKQMFDRQKSAGHLINPSDLMEPDAPGSTNELAWRREEP